MYLYYATITIATFLIGYLTCFLTLTNETVIIKSDDEYFQEIDIKEELRKEKEKKEEADEDVKAFYQ